MMSPAIASRKSSPRKMPRSPKNLRDILSDEASSSALLNTSERVSERLKAARKLFDPSDDNVPSKIKRFRPDDSLYITSIKNRVMKAGFLKPSAKEAADDNTCVVCSETNDSGILAVCSICFDAYHASCHSPSIPKQLRPCDQWQCNKCMISMYGISSSVYDFSLDSQEPLDRSGSVDYTSQSTPSIDHPPELTRLADCVHEELSIPEEGKSLMAKL